MRNRKLDVSNLLECSFSQIEIIRAYRMSVLALILVIGGYTSYANAANCDGIESFISVPSANTTICNCVDAGGSLTSLVGSSTDLGVPATMSGDVSSQICDDNLQNCTDSFPVYTTPSSIHYFKNMTEENDFYACNTNPDGLFTGDVITGLSLPVGVTFSFGNTIDVDDNRIVNLAHPPLDANDAATKAYVDSIDTDTNAATICANGTFLNGDGSCDPVVVDTNTNAATICANGTFLNGDGSCDPVVVDTNTNAATICPDGQYLNGDGSCYTARPAVTNAVFGVGPITHYDGVNWVLEATAVNTLELRRTGTTGFLNFSMTYPANCTGNGTGGSADMKQAFRYASTVGSSIAGTLCAEGSTLFVNVFDGTISTFFRCWKRSGNHNICQRYWH